MESYKVNVYTTKLEVKEDIPVELRYLVLDNPLIICQTIKQAYPLNEFRDNIIFLISLNDIDNILGMHIVNIGTLPRHRYRYREIITKIISNALSNNATKIAVVHYYPNEDYQTNLDSKLAKRIKNAANVFNIRLSQYLCMNQKEEYMKII